MTIEPIVIGVDGGGTRTRVMAAKLSGDVLAYAEGGCANPRKDPEARRHVQETIREALRQAGAEAEQVVSLAAGFAGLDEPDDRVWAELHVSLPGLGGRKRVFNDAVAAHAGAFLTEPGIVAISGTGSIVFAIDERGHQRRNYDFRHYAPTSARHLPTAPHIA